MSILHAINEKYIMDIDDEDDDSSYSSDIDRIINHTVSYVFNTNQITANFRQYFYEFKNKVELWADSLSFVNDYSLGVIFLNNDGKLAKRMNSRNIK